jgi:hypothetical protein
MDDWWYSLKTRTQYDLELSARNHARFHSKSPTLAQIIGGLPQQFDRESKTIPEPTEFYFCVEDGAMKAGFFMPKLNKPISEVQKFYGGQWVEYISTDWWTMRAKQREIQFKPTEKKETVSAFEEYLDADEEWND